MLRYGCHMSGAPDCHFRWLITPMLRLIRQLERATLSFTPLLMMLRYAAARYASPAKAMARYALCLMSAFIAAAAD